MRHDVGKFDCKLGIKSPSETEICQDDGLVSRLTTYQMR